MTTFCWLPPLSWPTGVSTLDVLIARSRIVRSASALRRRPLIIGSIGLATIEARLASPTLKARLFVRTSPSARRSSGTKPIPARTACGRAAGRKAPAIQRHRAPVGPVGAEEEACDLASARADEAAKSKHLALAQVETDLVDFRRPAEPAHGERHLACRGGRSRSSEFPRSRRRRSPRPMPGASGSRRSSSATERPSRKTVTRWHSSRISSRRWETYRIATPDLCRSRMMLNSLSLSAADNAAVGSSMTMSRAL